MNDILSTVNGQGFLLEVRGPNNLRRVTVRDHPVVEAYRSLRSELGHDEWADLLSPATLRVCWYLNEPHRISEIEERLEMTRQGVHTPLSPLKQRAMLRIWPRIRVD